MTRIVWLILGCVMLLSACAGSQTKPAQNAPAVAPEAVQASAAWRCLPDESTFDCDRRAILAMVGEYEVRFSFDETTVLAPGYGRHEPQRSGAHETVVLIEDAGRRIDLQHLLVVGEGQVVKHWRQVWEYGANQRWTFEGEQRFRTSVPVQAATGTWTQSVHEVNDAPRYTGTGRWQHAHGVAAWTSDTVWRPLPRREYTKRDDYDVLAVVNRQTITPTGWAHEQDNTKLVLQEDGQTVALVREVGFNDYRRVRGVDFSPAYVYWRETMDYWVGVRARWARLLSASDGFRLDLAPNDGGLVKALFEGADAFRKQPDLDAAMANVDAALDRYVLPLEPVAIHTD
jgi:hypothetical protein